MSSKFATPYARPAPSHVKISAASLTRQEFAAECDLNQIMSRYARGLEQLPSADGRAMFGDVAHIPDYQAALDLVIQADDAFAALPSAVRKRFDNDPARLVAWLQDDSNRAEAVKLGIVSPPVDKSVSGLDQPPAAGEQSSKQ